MILVDANLLLYAYDAASPRHDAARQWWERCLSGDRLVRLSWLTVLAFLRIATHPRVFMEPMTVEEAVEHIRSWLARPIVGMLEPTARHWEILEQCLQNSQASGNLVMDAHLAALAIEHGAILCSTDRDFSRFADLTWKNPLHQEMAPGK
ncbi:MAG: type II toxin-antitoxin system VapC family toxin [Bradymonadales bacterium]|nr:type II toxin-antitoxin system VapC family toxin [Bradymonadales bacterium]